MMQEKLQKWQQTELLQLLQCYSLLKQLTWIFPENTKFNKWVNTVFAIVLLLVAAIVLGLQSQCMYALEHGTLSLYILIASVAPVWALLQPRDYLNSYLVDLYDRWRCYRCICSEPGM